MSEGIPVKSDDSGLRKNGGKHRALWATVIALAVALAAVSTALFFALTPEPTTPHVLLPPAEVHVTAGDSALTVTWVNVDGATSYNLYIASSPGVTKENYLTLPDGACFENVASPYTVTGLLNDKTYYVRVTASNGETESGMSVETSVTPTASPPVLSPPMNMQATAGDAMVVVSWGDVTGATSYNLYFASAPGVTKDNYLTLPDGVRYVNVASPYAVGSLTNGQTYYVRTTACNDAMESDVSAEASATPTSAQPPITMYVSGLTEFDSGAPVVGAQVTVRTEDGSTVVHATTGANGRLNVGLSPALPTRILVEVTYQETGGPPATGFRWSPILDTGGAVDIGRIVLPNPAGKELVLGGGTATSPDGQIVVQNIPANVASMYARTYEADVTPDVFPGDLAEGRLQPINNIVFLWITALDASGNPVFTVDPPATVRIAVPSTQWVDLEDLQPGNGMIDTPIYSFDYDTAYWEREPDGWLTDSAGVVLDETLEMDIRTGTYAGEVYGEFKVTHFSWWNIDKPPKDCGPDFGDADDPPYPSLLANDGARHLDICRAWLGAWVDAEDDAEVPNKDFYDDSVLSIKPLKFRVSNWNWPSDLYLNVLVDTNDDGDWEDSGEWIVQNLVVSVPKGKGKLIETDVEWDADSWMRVTLTGDPITSYVGKGEFAIGETEDYPFLSFRLSVYVSGNGTVTSDPPGIDCTRGATSNCSAEFRGGSNVTLTATPEPGQSFIEWGADCSHWGSNATCTLMMDKDHFAIASFTAPFYLLTVYVFGHQNYTSGGNVTSDPPGIHCGGYRDPGTKPENCSALFPRDSNVTLTATPDPGWLFDHWEGACSGTSPTCVVKMDTDKEVLAYFWKP